jgi:adenosylcobinamide kinase / adenosylcobinamide-phosphate guanylyltransferase
MSVLITGGVKSGKSSYALRIAENWKSPKYFLATAIAFDDEMKKKIKRHQEERSSQYETIEEPIYIDKFRRNRIVVDCITLWMNNVFYREMEDGWEDILRRFLDGMSTNTIIVTNETGFGNIPADALSRRYNNALGNANKIIAEAVDEVFLMVAGLPVKIK